jgi:uncharacterized protein (DUF1330 family)
MSAYLVFVRDATLDPSELAIYTQQVAATTEGHSIKALALRGRQQALEGADAESVALFEFSSFEAAHAWYDSPAYRAVREHRFKGATYRVLLVDGTNKNA